MTDHTFDAIVVGAGSVGTPAAWHLSRKGLRVLVIEKRAAAGQGENKAAIGGIRATHSDPAKISLCRRSLELMTTWRETYGDDVGWKPGGYAFPVYSESLKNTLTGLFPIQQKWNLDIEWIDADAMAALIPGICREGLLGGTYSPGDGQLSPIRVPVAFQRAAVLNGAVFRFNETVRGYLVSGGAVKGVQTDSGTWYAPVVVVATGADAREHGQLLGLDLPITPDSHEAGITSRVAPFLGPLVVDMRPGPEGKTANFYFAQNREGQIIFCYTPKELFVGTDRENTAEFLPVLASRMISLIPRMRHLMVRRIWRGLYPMTPDGIPIVDRVTGIDGLILAVGMCGQGFMLGPGVGEEVAALALTGKSGLSEEAHACIRLSRDFYKSSTEALK